MSGDIYNQREYARAKVTWAARLECGGQSANATVCNISVNGVYIETKAEIRQGDTVRLLIRAMHEGQAQSIRCEGKVIRHIFLSDMRGHGYGITASLDPADLAFIETVIAAKTRYP